MLQQGDVEAAIRERKLQRAAGLERHLPALPGAIGQIARRFDKGLGEVDAGHLAAGRRGEKARRAADAGADIKHRHICGNGSKLSKLGGRQQAPGVELVEPGELFRCQPLVIRPERRKRRLQPRGQSGRAIMLAHAFQHIGHWRNSFSLPACPI
jgi:hypothetical protein